MESRKGTLYPRKDALHSDGEVLKLLLKCLRNTLSDPNPDSSAVAAIE
jgi:hypothetical protein